MALSSVVIGSVACLVDPDNISVQASTPVAIKKAMSGNTYVIYAEGVAGYPDVTVTVSGQYLPESSAQSLLAMRNSIVKVSVAGAGVALPGGNYLVRSVQVSPMKPMVEISANTSIKYSYSVTLVEVI